MQNLDVAVITGGHSYDVPRFHKLFNSIEGINPFIQHMDDFASSAQDMRNSYDAVLFYVMFMDEPSDEGLPWYSGKPKTALKQLGDTAQGIVVLHHAILAYPQWPAWNDIVGISDRKFGYHLNQSVHVKIADSHHPITNGLSDWKMNDETYTMHDASDGSNILLTTRHPQSMNTIAWTRQYKNSRVFCFESGHDNEAWEVFNFKEMLRRGILWSAQKI